MDNHIAPPDPARVSSAVDEIFAADREATERAEPAGDGLPEADEVPERQPVMHIISKPLTLRLFTSHFLSTWNSRLFEAAVVYFLASIFPDNLQPISIYALVRNAAAILLTQPVGHWIDNGNRLAIVQISILAQRVSVALSCVLFWILLQVPNLSTQATQGLFSAAVALGCIEKLFAGVNLVSVERDWVVVITEENEDARRSMNARMRRIDLFCKLVGPLIIALIAAASVPIAMYTTLGMNLVSVPLECLFIRKVFKMVPTLRRPSRSPAQSRHSEQRHRRPPNSVLGWFGYLASRLSMFPSLKLYFTHPAFIPSFSLSLLYMTVLAFSGQMLTYMLAANITQWQVGIIRAISTVFELSATWIAPRLMKRIGVLRTGLWSVVWQMSWLAAGVSWFFYFYGHGYPTTSIMPASGLAAAAILSRVGLWGFDLTAQIIVQDEVQGDRRGVFSTTETAFQNLFDLLAWALTIIWSDPASFQWPAIISIAAVYTAGGLYTYFLRQRRGHLIHIHHVFLSKESRGDSPATLRISQ